ncbi:galactokinase [Candidatus Woesearchaeota archaeon]|nr:galactokinase [Candidatus Woesearchaeota archaeon]
MIISRTPMRISIGGGGTDLPYYYTKNGGSLVSAAIDKFMYISVNKRFHNTSLIKYSKIEEVNDNKKIEHPLIREALSLLNIKEPIEITSIADISSGTGLGSSGSFTAGLLNALHLYKGEYVSKKTIAEEACHIEMDILKDPVGKQDQYIASFGGIMNMNISQKGNVSITPLDISWDTIKELEENILLFYTGVRRSSFTVLKSQKQEAEKDYDKMEYLGKIKKIGNEIKSALEKGNTRRFGQWLNIHWQTKKQLTNKMSNPDIDKWYETALKNGALGGKIMGAGGGGFFMFYAEENHHEMLRSAMKEQELHEFPFKFDFDGTKIILNQR